MELIEARCYVSTFYRKGRDERKSARRDEPVRSVQGEDLSFFPVLAPSCLRLPEASSMFSSLHLVSVEHLMAKDAF